MHKPTDFALAITALLAAGCATVPPPALERPEPAWSVEFDHPVTYHKVVGDDLLMIGTTRHLYAADPTNGDLLWRLRNVNASARDVVHVEGEPYLLINDAGGGAFDDLGTHVLSVDRNDGLLLWESPVLSGRGLQARIDYEENTLFVVTVPQAHGDDSGILKELLPGKGLMSGLKREPEMTLINLNDGSVLWSQPFGADVPMRPSYRHGVGGSGAAEDYRPFDLGLYHPPATVGEQICVNFSGISCYDMESGQPTWSRSYEVVDDELALSYPNPISTPDVLITADTRRAYRLDPDSGRVIWRSEKIGRVPEWLDDEDIVFAQVGGRYFDMDKERWVARGNFAVVALNKRNGNVLWEHEKVYRSISNLMVAGPFVWVADERYLFALDRLDGSVGLQVPHRLGEPPNYVLLNENQQIVLISESEAAGYHQDSGKLLWYESYPAPRPSAWRRLAGSLMTASGSIFKLSSTVIAYGSGMLPSIPNITFTDGRKLISGKSLLKRTTGMLGESLYDMGSNVGDNSGYANLTGKSQYFLTELEEYDDEVVLAAVDLNQGTTRRLTVLPAQTTQIVIDEVNGLLYQAIGHRLVAVPLGE
ncbi:MAG: PQQ-binding-like beta-propeller repeat protein [Xanthomonadales bacterium]|nr:PQQ-binding-like beta-propeller repeat protein [Xanthomonadales bacterium]